MIVLDGLTVIEYDAQLRAIRSRTCELIEDAQALYYWWKQLSV